jgi:hypothetical protein
MLTGQQITARTNTLQIRTIRNRRVALAATDSLHSTMTATKAAQEIDRALLAQVCSLLPSGLFWCTVLAISCAEYCVSGHSLHFNDSTSNSWRATSDSTHSLVIVESRHFNNSSTLVAFSLQLTKSKTATMSRSQLNMNSTNPRTGTPNQDTNA